MTWLWGGLAAIALLWPDRISGPLDGIPLDRAVEAIVVGAILPALWALHPQFLRSSFARGCIVLLVAWKACASMVFVQDGWCVRFEPARPFAKDASGAPHAWDLRADWRAPEPVCSAVMTRSYHDLHEFPVWFFNLPPPSDSWPLPEDGRRRDGRDAHPRVLRAHAGRSVRHRCEHARVCPATAARSASSLGRTGHRRDRRDLTGGGGGPLWNGEDGAATTTVEHPSRFNVLAVRGPVDSADRSSALLLAWLAPPCCGSAIQPCAWAAGASLVIGIARSVDWRAGRLRPPAPCHSGAAAPPQPRGALSWCIRG